jgi:hypothetical protein
VPLRRESLSHPGLDTPVQADGVPPSQHENAAEPEHILPVLLTAAEDNELIVRQDEEIPDHLLGGHPERSGDVELDLLPAAGGAAVEYEDIVVPKPEVQLSAGDTKLHEGPPPRAFLLKQPGV